MRSGWVGGGGVTDEKGGSRKRGGQDPLTPPPPLDTPMHSLCYKLVKTRNQYYFSIQSYGILKTPKTSNLKAHNDEKMAVKEKEPYFNII